MYQRQYSPHQASETSQTRAASVPRVKTTPSPPVHTILATQIAVSKRVHSAVGSRLRHARLAAD